MVMYQAGRATSVVKVYDVLGVFWMPILKQTLINNFRFLSGET